MKKVFVYSLLAILALTSCQAEMEDLNPENNDNIQAKVFTATIDDGFKGETKTSLNGEGNVLWKQYDQVSIFSGSTLNEHYQVSDASDGKTTATLIKIPEGGYVAGTEIGNNVAFYPYASSAELAKSGSNYVISEIELPATQTYAAGSFGNGAFPMAAVTSSNEDMNLKFKNVLGGLKLQLKGTATITSITVRGNNNEILCGDAEVTTTYGGIPSITLSDASAKTVTLDCGVGVTLDSETATPFIIALPPMTMTGGFTVTVTDSESKQMEIKTTKSQTITRSSLLKMPAVNYVGGYDYFTVTSTGSTSVMFYKGSYPISIDLEYRKNTGSWATYTIDTNIDLVDGESIQFRAGEGGNESFTYNLLYNQGCKLVVDGTGTVSLSGNIMSLLDKNMVRDDAPTGCFADLFRYNTKIADASGLKLPATTLAEQCYSGMFIDCTSLTTPPEILPALTLASRCYEGMFSGCTKLTKAPILPATTLTERCYDSMFYNCRNLQYVKALFTTSPGSSYTYNWLLSVSATGTFVKSSSATWDVTGVHGIPSGWTIQTE